MKTFKFSLLIIAAFSVLPFVSAAQSAPAKALHSTASGDFTKHRYKINGQWTIKSSDGKNTLSFSDDFKTKGGPDLKVFLSPKKLGDLSGSTALTGAVKLGILKSNKGEQSYILPEGVTPSDFGSIIIQCEAYSVLWGGFDLPAQ